MKKIDLGQAITILANVGVIVGIGFLAVEVNQNNALLRNEARYNLHLARTAEIEQLALNPGLGELWAKARDGERLTALETDALGSTILGRFVRWEWYYEQYRNGLIEPEVLPLAAWRRVFRVNPFVYEQWKQDSELLTPEFVQFMEENVIPEQ